MDIAKYEIDPMYVDGHPELDIYVSKLGDWYDVKEVDAEIERLKGELSKAVATIRLYEETLNARL